MPAQMFNLYLFLPAFGLVVLRMGGMMLTAPIMSGVGIPGKIKVFLIIAMSLAVFPMVAPTLPPNVPLGGLAAGAAGELMIGMTIGFCLSLTVLAMQMAGLLIGQQAGFALAQIFDPQHGQRFPVMSQFYSLMTLVFFLVVGGHRALVSGLLDTFDRVPPFSLAMRPQVIHVMCGLLIGAFAVAFKVAAPALLSLFLTTLATGFVARTVPQLNILSVGFVVKIAVTLLVASVALVAAANVYQGFFDLTVGRIGDLWR